MNFGKAGEAAFEAAVSIAVGAVMGIFIDRWLGTTPWLMILFLVAALYTALKRLIALGPKPPAPPTDPPPADPE